MKKITLIFTLLAGSITFAQVPCAGGNAAGFPCEGFNLQFDIPASGMSAGTANDSWGWTDPLDGKEYAIIALDNGTAFFDISDPVNSVYLGKLPSHAGSGPWRDVKVYSNHAYVVAEESGHGMQVFDLTRLRSVANPPATFTEDGHYDEFGRAHNIVINEDTGFAYAVGTSTFSGGPHFIDLSNPTNPVSAGGYSLDGYTHDAQVVIYDGPDTDYTGREIFFGSNEDNIVIVDVTDKNDPSPISIATYSNVGYSHQGWLTEDHRYFVHGDEGDEDDFGFNTTTRVFDFSDLDNPTFFFDYTGPNASIDHNGYVVGNTFYLSNYSSGLRAIDITDIASGDMTEVGYFDTIPGNNGVNFSGSWNVYPFFASGNIVISGSEGFFLVNNPLLGVEELPVGDFALSPNPATNRLTVSSKNVTISQVTIYNVLGQMVLDKSFSNSFSETLNISNLNSGMYLVKINNTTTKRLVVN
ncbi:MAG: choice-of-anchor B family protein [Bacteroidota bacterium]